MSRHPDRKLECLSTSVLGRVCSSDEIAALARVGDHVTRTASEVIHGETDPNLWSYLVIAGDVGVSHRGSPIAVSAAGSLLLPSRSYRGGGSPATLTALGDVEVLAFSRRMIGAAVDRVPGFGGAGLRVPTSVGAN
jgi:hypothetical protein